MDTVRAADQLSAEELSTGMDKYKREGPSRALALDNRGPIKLNKDGTLDEAILEAYWKHGFYVLKEVIGVHERAELRADAFPPSARVPSRASGGGVGRRDAGGELQSLR